MFICFLIFASVSELRSEMIFPSDTKQIGHFSLDRNDPQNTPHSGIAMIW